MGLGQKTRTIRWSLLLMVMVFAGLPVVPHTTASVSASPGHVSPGKKHCKIVKKHGKTRKVCTKAKAPAATATPTSTPTPSPTATATATPTPTLETAPAFSGKVDIGGYSLYLTCTGGPGPAVFVDYGYHGSRDDYAAIRASLGSFVDFCQYDRAGEGQSDRGPVTPTTSGQIVKEMHALITNAHLHTPLVLVGSSFGGLNVRLYAYTYPGDVAGMVLLDSVNENFFSFFPDSDLDLNASFAQLKAASHGDMKGTLGSLPLVVVTHGIPIPFIDDNNQWLNLQKQLAGESSNAIHVIATTSGHRIDVENPPLATEAIREVVVAARSHSHALPPCGPALTQYNATCMTP